MLLISQQRPRNALDGLMKHTSCVKKTDGIYLHQMLHKQLLNYYRKQNINFQAQNRHQFMTYTYEMSKLVAKMATKPTKTQYQTSKHVLNGTTANMVD